MKSRTLILINLLMFSGVLAASTPASIATAASSAVLVRDAAASPSWVVAPASAKLVEGVAVRAAAIAPLDYLLMFLVIAGLVTVQLRRTQDVAQRAFVGH